MIDNQLLHFIIAAALGYCLYTKESGFSWLQFFGLLSIIGFMGYKELVDYGIAGEVLTLDSQLDMLANGVGLLLGFTVSYLVIRRWRKFEVLRTNLTSVAR